MKKILETLSLLTAIRMLTIPEVFVLEANVKELNFLKSAYETILEILPAPEPWQIGLKYVIYLIHKELKGIEVIVSIANALTQAFGGHIQDVDMLFGTMVGG